MGTICHGKTVPVVLSSLVVVAALDAGACRPRERQRPASPSPETLPPPEQVTEVIGQERPRVPAQMQELRPAAILPPGERLMVFNVSGPMRLVVAGQGDAQRPLAEVEAESGQVLVVDRQQGIRLGQQVLRRGSLDAQTTYVLYALPAGGVRHEMTRTRVRPQTPEEHQAALEQQREEARRRQEEEPTTRPATDPDG